LQRLSRTAPRAFSHLAPVGSAHRAYQCPNPWL